jgi:long-chain acyl-CoA synthetase
VAETVGETLWDVLAAHRANRADATAIVFEGARTDYATLYDRARSAARALAASGIGTGDRFIYLGKNSDTYFELLFAAAMAGAVLTPVGWRLAAAEAAFIIDDAEARLVVVGPEGNVQAAAVRALLGGDPLFLGVEDGSYAAWRDQAGDVAPPAVSPDNVVLQL